MERYYPQILWEYLGAERDRSHEDPNGTTRKAAGICGASQSASEAAKRAEPVGREERSSFGRQVKLFEEEALKTMAIADGLWVNAHDFYRQYSNQYIGEGAEQKVYLKEDGKTVLKINPGRFHTTWLDYFNRLLFHAFFFPATKYTVVGFTEQEEQFAVITEQPFAILNQGASRNIVESYLNTWVCKAEER